MEMKVILVFLTLLVLTLATKDVDIEQDFNGDKNYFDNDFEFVDEVSTSGSFNSINFLRPENEEN